MNKQGHAETLQARQLGNQNALTHGAYRAGAGLTPRADEIAAGISAEARHLTSADRLLVEELARMKDLSERFDLMFAKKGLAGRRDNISSALAARLSLSRRISQLCRELGLTPAARVGWVAELTEAEALSAVLAQDRQGRGTVR